MMLEMDNPKGVSMVDKIDPTNPISGAEAVVIPLNQQNFPDTPAMVEEVNVRDALSATSEVLNDLAKTIDEYNYISSPDADRSRGDVSADIFDLISS